MMPRLEQEKRAPRYLHRPEALSIGTVLWYLVGAAFLTDRNRCGRLGGNASSLVEWKQTRVRMERSEYGIQPMPLRYRPLTPMTREKREQAWTDTRARAHETGMAPNRRTVITGVGIGGKAAADRSGPPMPLSRALHPRVRGGQ